MSIAAATGGEILSYWQLPAALEASVVEATPDIEAGWAA
jgi:hypothetical protein